MTCHNASSTSRKTHEGSDGPARTLIFGNLLDKLGKSFWKNQTTREWFCQRRGDYWTELGNTFFLLILLSEPSRITKLNSFKNMLFYCLNYNPKYYCPCKSYCQYYYILNNNVLDKFMYDQRKNC